MKWYRYVFIMTVMLFSFANAQVPTLSVDMEANSQAIQPTLEGASSGTVFKIAIRGSVLSNVRTYECTIQFDPTKFEYVTGSAQEDNTETSEQNILKANDALSTFPQVDIQGDNDEIIVFTNTILGQPDLEANGEGLLCVISFTSNLSTDESGTFQITAGRTIDKGLNVTDITNFNHGLCSEGSIYTVTVSAGANGSVDPSGDVFVSEAGNLSVSATPDLNHHFLDWTVVGDITVTDDDETGEFTVNGNGSITASFEVDPVPGMSVDMNPALSGIQAEIVGSETGEEFTIEIRGHDLSDVRSYECNVNFDHTQFEYVSGSAQEGNTETGEQNFLKDKGASQTLFQVNIPGDDNIVMTNTIMGQPSLMVDGDGLLASLKFTSLLGEGGSGTFQIEAGKTLDTELNETDITFLNDGVYHSPFFVEVSSGGNGTVTPSGRIPVRAGANMSVVADPAENYHFNQWDITGGITEVSGDETGEFTVNGSGTITGTFAINTYTVTFVPGPNGTITGTLTQTVPHGGSCTQVTAVPEANHHFTGWTGDFTGTTNPLTVTNVTSDMTVTANFAINTYTVTFIAGSNGSITGTLSQTVAHGGSCTPVTAVPNAGYHFTGWTGDFTGTTNPLTVTNVTSDMTVTANFAINNYTVTFVAGSNGSITGTLSQTVAHGGSCTPVTAVPNAGYHFTGWTGDFTGTTNPLTVTNVTSDMTITANFTINSHTVTFIAGSNGTITGTLTQTIAHGGSCTPVTAVPNTGYKLKDWTGDFAGTANPLTVTNVTSNMTITANFDIITAITNEVNKPASGYVFWASPNVIYSGNKVCLLFSGKGVIDAKLVIYDVLGHALYKNSYDSEISSEKLKEFDTWNLNNINGRKVASGTYIAILIVKYDNGNLEKFKTMIGVKEY